MQTVSEVMTRDVRFVSPRENLQRAAQMMDELNVGVLPVCDGERLVGMVTDRDITVRGTAAGRAPEDAHVEEVMSTDVRWVFEDQPLDDVMRQMADTRIRRVPVVTHDETHRLIGIVSLGDLATAQGGDPRRVEHVVEEISTPSEPDRSTRGTGGPADNAGASAIPRRDTFGASGSDTGTATGLAGSDMTDIGGGSGDPALAAENEDSAELGSAARAAESDSSGGLGDSKGAGARGMVGTATAGGIIPGANANPRGTNEPGADPGLQRTRKAGSTDVPAGAAGMGDTGGQDANRNTAAPGGIDAAGPSGASGGTGGAAGTSGTGVGAKP